VVVASLRYELAIPLVEEDEVGHLLYLSMMTVVGMTLLTGTGVLFLGRTVAELSKTPGIERYLWLLPISLLGAGTYQVFSMCAIRYGAYPQIARTKMTQALGQVVSQVLLGVVAMGSLGLMMGDVVGRVSGSATLAMLVWNRNKERLGRPLLPRLKRLAVRYQRFPLVSSWSALLNSAGLYLPPLVLAGLYGPQTAGWFALAQRIVAVPMTLVGQAVAQVYLGEASRMIREDPTSLRRLFLHTTRKLFLFGGAPIILIGIISPSVFGLVFGPDWSPAGAYVQSLSLAFLAQFVASPVSQTLNVLEHQGLQLVWDAARLLLIAGGFGLSYVMGWSGEVALRLYGAVMIISYIALLLMIGVCIGRRADQSYERT
jgi:O-antigen/teichoic acid export membrane protein